jgi:hypothetical protein
MVGAQIRFNGMAERRSRLDHRDRLRQHRDTGGDPAPW